MDFTTFLKKESIQQLKHIVNQCINEIYLDAYLQTKKSNLVNNFYQSANEDYAQYRINQITSNLNQKLVEIFKNTKPNLIDSRKCPPHIQPNKPYIPVKLNQINNQLIDTAKQREFAKLFESYKFPKSLTFFDIETDGLQLNCNILQISLLKVQVQNNPYNPLIIENTLTTYIKPFEGYVVDKQNPAIQINKITQENINNAPTFKQIAANISDALVLDTLVGFNINKFDIPILIRHLQSTCETPSWSHTIDLATAYWKHYPSTLEKSVMHLTNMKYQNLHNAQNDAAICIDLFAELIKNNKIPNTATELLNMWKYPELNEIRNNQIVSLNNHISHPWISPSWQKLYQDNHPAPNTSNNNQETPILLPTTQKRYLESKQDTSYKKQRYL